MRSAATFLLLLFAQPAWSQTPRAAPAFDLSLAVSVFTAALAFIAPRALDPVTVQEIALWGLAAPGALDGALSTELRDGTVVLLKDGKLVYSRPIPGPDGPANQAPAAWGALIADVLDAAAKASPAVATAGLQGLISTVFETIFDHLDPYSRYVAPGDADLDRARRLGEAGIGATVVRAGRTTTVSGMNADGPAAEAGLRTGDRILAVDGQATASESLATVQGWLAGLEGSFVTLTVRSRTGPPHDIDIERAVTTPETVFASRDGDLLVLRISSFSVDTDQRLQRELDRNLAGAARRAVHGIVIDLRGNRGGRLVQAVAAIDLFLDRGIVAITAGRSPEAAHTWKAGPGDLATGIPIVVLVDGRSASAAEIMAAALSDQGRAVVVGSATLGKGLVQAIAHLPNDGELFVSWSRVLAPAGWPLQGLGVLPQVCTSLGQDALTGQLQALDRGQQPMADILAHHRAARAPLPAARALAIRNACPASEPRDADMAAARFMIAHPAAYLAARLAPPTP